MLTTGDAAVFPSPQSAVAEMVSDSSSNNVICCIVPRPSQISVNSSNIRLVPSRHGIHFPQDSFCVKFMKNLATSTIQLLSFITTSPPLPIMAPTFFRESKSNCKFRWSSLGLIQRHPPDGPPIWTALNSPPLTPPPISKITLRSGVPIGTSISPVFITFPVKANAFVPWFLSGPIVLYQSAPLLMIGGTLQ